MRNSAAALLVVPTLLATLSVAGERRVLIIGVDGLRPDCLAAAETPNIDRLIADGTYQRILQKWGTTPSAIPASQINPRETR